MADTTPDRDAELRDRRVGFYASQHGVPLEEFVRAPEPERRPPEPGTGRVFIRSANEPELYWAVWAGDEHRVAEFYGSYNEVLDWARATHAPSVLTFSEAADQYVPLAPG